MLVKQPNYTVSVKQLSEEPHSQKTFLVLKQPLCKIFIAERIKKTKNVQNNDKYLIAVFVEQPGFPGSVVKDPTQKSG